MLCMTFHNSLLTASNCSDLRSVKVKGGIISYHYQTALISVMTISVCVLVGLAPVLGGRRLRPGHRSQSLAASVVREREVRAPVASGQVITTSCDALTFQHSCISHQAAGDTRGLLNT